MNELLNILNLKNSGNCGEHIRLTCVVEFEPNGHASETFEPYWQLTLVKIPFHWLSTSGWKLGASTHPMTFKADGKRQDGFQKVVSEATEFLKWYYTPTFLKEK